MTERAANAATPRVPRIPSATPLARTVHTHRGNRKAPRVHPRPLYGAATLKGTK